LQEKTDKKQAVIKTACFFSKKGKHPDKSEFEEKRRSLFCKKAPQKTLKRLRQRKL
jgi:hypothetical protein